MNPLDAFSKKYFTEKKIFKLPHQDAIDPSTTHGFICLLNHPETNHLWVTQIISNILAIPWLNLDDFEANQIPLHVTSEPLLRQYPILPLWKQQSRLYIGLSNPLPPLLLEVTQFYTQCPIRLILV